MRKIFEGNYKKLNEDVSFQILRTNPRLTTNTKLMYDGEKLYMESYNANELLSTTKYKHKRIYKSGLYNNDIKNFLNGTGSSAYAIGKKMNDTVIGNDYGNQFENMYWCGCEEVSSKLYNEEFGIIAPIYLKKNIPNYFVVFKIDGPSNIDEDGDGNIDYDNILSKSKIVKSFDLREGSPIGDYLKRYTSQQSFEFDKSIYVNYSTSEIYYYGIDISTGQFARKIENFESELQFNDNTILHSDDWITNGFYRNGLIFPYIINIEFLFDDSDTEEYKFCRYFGMYCDDIDLYQLNDNDVDNAIIPVNRDNMYYIKDKFENLHSLQKYITCEIDDKDKRYTYFYPISNVYDFMDENNNIIDIFKNINKFNYEFRCETKDGIISSYNIDKIDEIGFGDYKVFNLTDLLNIDEDIDEDINEYIEKIGNKNYFENACVVMVSRPSSAEYNKSTSLKNRNKLCITNTDESIFKGYCQKSISAYCNYEDGLGYSSYMFSIEKKLYHGETIKISNGSTEYTFIAEQKIYDNISKIVDNPVGNFISNRFSCNGENHEVAYTLCKCINSMKDIPFTASNVGNIVTIKHGIAGEIYNNYEISFSDSITYNNKIKSYSLNGNKFSGGTDNEGCRFKIHSDDIIQFIGESNERYIKTPSYFDESKIISYSYYIDEYGEIDPDDFIITTDKNGKYIKISDVKLVEILDKFYPNVGLLSFYPIRDFDFDTIYSSYCDNSAFTNEVISYANDMSGNDDTVYDLYINNLNFGRIYNSIGDKISSEYNYYNENIIPSLCTVSKTAPYISKWGYVNGIDSCENPYRLNCSKIFGVNNFSSNMFLSEGSILDYTHDMPYYIYSDLKKKDTYGVNNYQYIYHHYNSSDAQNNYNECVKYWKELFERTDKDMFESLFEIRNNDNNYSRRNHNKFSRFNGGTNKRNSETLFRGVKFETINLAKINEDNKLKGVENIYKKGYKTFYSNKFNDYRFSFIIIPVKNSGSLYFNSSIYFVKNDKFKFIVGYVVCNMFDSIEFNKSYIYSGCYRISAGNKIKNNMSGLNISNFFTYEYGDKNGNLEQVVVNGSGYDSDSDYDYDLVGLVDTINEINDSKEKVVKSIRECYMTMNLNEAFKYSSHDNIIYLNKLIINSPIIKLLISNSYKLIYDCKILEIKINRYDKDGNTKTYVTYENNEISINNSNNEVYINSYLNGDTLEKVCDDEEFQVRIKFRFDMNFHTNKNHVRYEVKDGKIYGVISSGKLDEKSIEDYNDEEIFRFIYSDVVSMYNNISLYNIKENINNQCNVVYNSDDYAIKIVEPVPVKVYDIFEDNVKSVELSNDKVIESYGIGLKNELGDVCIKIINRYSGYYQPIFKDIIFYNDFETKNSITNKKIIHKFTNTSFNYEYKDNMGSFGIINNMFFHKINEENKVILKSLEPYYPLIGEYALDFRDYNVFSSNWDSRYYTKQKDLTNFEELEYISDIKNSISMFGSKYMNVPETISISKFNGIEEWNDEYIDSICDSEVMYREVNSNNVEYYLFLRERIIRYFCELKEIKDEFDKWIDESKSYGDKETLEDDIREYVEKNILNLYEISNIKLFVKKVKRGVNDYTIENDYEKYISYSERELINSGFSEVTSFSISNISSNSFDRKISYVLSSGIQEYFGFSFTITKK